MGMDRSGSKKVNRAIPLCVYRFTCRMHTKRGKENIFLSHINYIDTSARTSQWTLIRSHGNGMGCNHSSSQFLVAHKCSDYGKLDCVVFVPFCTLREVDFVFYCPFVRQTILFTWRKIHNFPKNVWAKKMLYTSSVCYVRACGCVCVLLYSFVRFNSMRSTQSV